MLERSPPALIRPRRTRISHCRGLVRSLLLDPGRPIEPTLNLVGPRSQSPKIYHLRPIALQIRAAAQSLPFCRVFWHSGAPFWPRKRDRYWQDGENQASSRPRRMRAWEAPASDADATGVSAVLELGGGNQESSVLAPCSSVQGPRKRRFSHL